MARINKKSRIKGLPAKVLLQAKDNHSGSFPGKFRTSSDGNTGTYHIFFNDNKTVNFISGNINLGAATPTTILTNDLYVEFGQDMSSSIETTGVVRKGVADNNISFNDPDTSKFEPYKEHIHLLPNTFTSFYLSGTNINDGGLGFEQPLLSKTKIVIDLTSDVSHSIAIRNFTSQSRNYPMCYWNNALKVWEGIGTGKEFSHADYFYVEDSLSSSIKTAYENLFNEQTIGFSPASAINPFVPSYISNRSLIPENTATPTNNFLFPSHDKFIATSSNLCNMANYINKPFLLEKVVLEISCTFNQNRFIGQWFDYVSTNQSFFGASAPILNCTFFILNQMNAVKDNFTKNTDVYQGNIAIKTNITSSTNSYLSRRDLVTWGDVILCTKVTENLLRTNAVIFGSSSLDNRGEYFDLTGSAFYDNYTDSDVIGDEMAAGIISSRGREIILGKDSTGVTILTGLEYKNLHPEFNTITGANGNRFGQYPDDASQAPFYGQLNYASWNRNLILEMNCKSPLKKNNILGASNYNYAFTPMTNLIPASSSHGFMYENTKGGPRFNDIITGRELKNPLRDPNFTNISGAIESMVFRRTVGPLADVTSEHFIKGYSERFVVGPYLLLPTDNLVFGWQLPISPALSYEFKNSNPNVNYEFSHTLGPQLTFSTSPAKITLYGSYIKEGKEYHDTLNQNLTSNSIYEVIGE